MIGTPTLEILSVYVDDDLLLWILQHTTLQDNGSALVLAKRENNYSTINILLQYNKYTYRTLINEIGDLPFTEPDEEDVGIIRDIYTTILVKQQSGREVIKQISNGWNSPVLERLYL